MNKKMQGKRILLYITVVITIVVCFLFLFGYFTNTNDLSLKKFAEQLVQYPLPYDWAILENQNLLGKLNGNGNGMDFAVVVLLQTNKETTINDLRNYYSSFNFKPAKGKSHIVELIVEPVKQSVFTNRYIEHYPLSFHSSMNYEEHLYYAVILYDGGYFAGLDLRGN